MIHALVSGVVTFVLALVLGAPILRYLRAQKAGKSIGEYQPESHQVKAGTPTFGGFIIWVPTLIVTAVAVDWREHRSILLPLAMIGITGAAGFVDDLGTLQRRTPDGAFMALQDRISHRPGHRRGVDSLRPDRRAIHRNPVEREVRTRRLVPARSPSPWSWQPPPPWPSAMAWMRSPAAPRSSRSSPTGSSRSSRDSRSWRRSPSSSPARTSAFSGTTPIRRMVIMGDTGALALGSSLAVIALMTGQWLVLPVIGIIFVMEALSDVIQVGILQAERRQARLPPRPDPQPLRDGRLGGDAGRDPVLADRVRRGDARRGDGAGGARMTAVANGYAKHIEPAELRGKRVLVYSMGIEGRDLARFFIRHGAHVTMSDTRDASRPRRRRRCRTTGRRTGRLRRSFPRSRRLSTSLPSRSSCSGTTRRSCVRASSASP